MSNRTAPNYEKYILAAADPKTISKLMLRSEPTPSGCRVWRRAYVRNGYGVLHFARKTLLAHRLSYWLFHGPIPGDLVVDHMCRNRGCIEPTHLRLLTTEENMADAWTAHKTHCKRGHPLSGDNIWIAEDSRGMKRRVCKTCSAIRGKAHRKQLRQAALSAG